MRKIETEVSNADLEKLPTVKATFHKSKTGFYAVITDPAGQTSQYRANDLKSLWYEVWSVLRLLRRIFKHLKQL